MSTSADSPPAARSVHDLLADISAERMMRDVAEIAREVRLSGTPEEARSFDYIAAELAATGLTVQRYQCDALVSLPGPASLSTTAPQVEEFTCITHSMSASTEPGGLHAPLTDLGAGSEEDFRRAEEAGPLTGRVALVNGLVSPGVVARAARHGCHALVFAGDEHLHQGIISTLYGSPTSRTMADLPRSVAVSVRRDTGVRLRELLARGPVEVCVRAEVDTGWRDIPLLVADLPGQEDTFAFFGVHVDSWDHGATDNAAGNAILLELARVFTARRDALRRGVRFLFWSGHSHGRYAGSCWYVDHFWQDLHDRAVVAMSIDSPGTVGANALGGAKVMDEAVAVATEAAELVVGHPVPAPRRPHGGEQPLWRVGVPSMNPVRSRHDSSSPYSLVFEPSSPWWHHTVDDTVDKVDPANLRKDAQIYAAALWRFVSEELLPLDYVALARTVADHLRGLPDVIDLSDLVDAATALGDAVSRMDRGVPEEYNRRLRLIGRALIPALYTLGGQFEPDPTSTKGFLPGLAGLRELANLDPALPRAHALRTELVRESARLRHALRTATDIATGSWT